MKASPLDLAVNWDAITALATVLVVFITFFANRTINKIQKYNALQQDRKYVEEIFLIQKKAHYSLGKKNTFVTDEVLLALQDAINLANLYNLTHIELHLKKIYDVCSRAWLLFCENHDDDGSALPSYTPEKRAEYHKFVRLAFEYFRDVRCYQHYLRIDGHSV